MRDVVLTFEQPCHNDPPVHGPHELTFALFSDGRVLVTVALHGTQHIWKLSQEQREQLREYLDCTVKED